MKKTKKKGTKKSKKELNEKTEEKVVKKYKLEKTSFTIFYLFIVFPISAIKTIIESDYDLHSYPLVLLIDLILVTGMVFVFEHFMNKFGKGTTLKPLSKRNYWFIIAFYFIFPMIVTYLEKKTQGVTSGDLLRGVGLSIILLIFPSIYQFFINKRD